MKAKKLHGGASKKGEEGWTFIETIIVLAIVLTLSTTVGFMGFRYIATAKKAAAGNQIEALNLALNALPLRLRTLSHTGPGTQSPFYQTCLLANTGTSWNGPYLEKPLEKDPWGNPYQYKVPGPDGLPYGIVSYGADGTEGGEGEDADIASWSN